ncbi:MAG: aminotransferase class V-fold PLP-dependent enzyme [bacterium]|nr:aminotransferase class V-fold PLP-dependent enzyme [bacterium]
MIATQQLAAHWTLSPDIRFLNHGSFGACPRVVLEAQAELRARLEAEPVRFMARELEGRLDAVREALGSFLGCRPRDLGFVPNATTAVNAVLRSFAFEPGDELVVTNHGYNACSNAARFVTERAGAKVVVADVPFPIRSEDEVVEAVLAKVNDRTRLLLIDHVTSPTAAVLPVERIVRELRERGVETLIDGAHAPGMLALDLDALGAGYYTGNCHKWSCAPKGAAFLHVREDLQESVRPAVISHGANSPRQGRSRFLVEFDWEGTDDPTPVLAVPVALEFFEKLLPGGWDEVRTRNRELALEARRILSATLGTELQTPDTMIGSLATVPLPDGASDGRRDAFTVDPLQAVLYDVHRIEVPVFIWPEAPRRWLRISAQLYNSEADYVALAEALQQAL